MFDFIYLNLLSKQKLILPTSIYKSKISIVPHDQYSNSLYYFPTLDSPTACSLHAILRHLMFFSRIKKKKSKQNETFAFSWTQIDWFVGHSKIKYQQLAVWANGFFPAIFRHLQQTTQTEANFSCCPRDYCEKLWKERNGTLRNKHKMIQGDKIKFVWKSPRYNVNIIFCSCVPRVVNDAYDFRVSFFFTLSAQTASGIQYAAYMLNVWFSICKPIGWMSAKHVRFCVSFYVYLILFLS